MGVFDEFGTATEKEVKHEEKVPGSVFAEYGKPEGPSLFQRGKEAVRQLTQPIPPEAWGGEEKPAHPEWGTRADGTPKGPGFLGTLKRPDGKISTELSIGVEMDGKETEIPSLVPTLTKDEIDHLLSGEKPTKQIIDKATEHARKRISEGKSPFAQEGEQPKKEPPLQQPEFATGPAVPAPRALAPLPEPEPKGPLGRAARELRPAIQTVEDIASVYAPLEAAANLFSQTYGLAATGIAQLVGLPFGKSRELGEAVSKATIYEPKTEAGKRLTKTAEYPFELLDVAGEKAADITREITGSPALATGVGTAIKAAPLALGVRKTALSALKSVTDSTWYRSLAIPERSLVVQSLDDMISKGLSEGEILRRWNNPSWREEALARRMKGEAPPEAPAEAAPKPEVAVKPKPSPKVEEPAKIKPSETIKERVPIEEPTKEEVAREPMAVKPGEAEKPAPEAEHLRPAIIHNGKVSEGEVGGTHPDILEAQDISPEEPHERGFISPEGKFLSRTEAKDWVRENQPKVAEELQRQTGTGEELYSEHYREAAGIEPAKEEAKPLEPPKGWTTVVQPTWRKTPGWQAELDWKDKRIVFETEADAKNPDIINHEIGHIQLEDKLGDVQKLSDSSLLEEYAKVRNEPKDMHVNFIREHLAMDYGQYLTNPDEVKPELKTLFDKYFPKEVPDAVKERVEPTHDIGEYQRVSKGGIPGRPRAGRGDRILEGGEVPKEEEKKVKEPWEITQSEYLDDLFEGIQKPKELGVEKRRHKIAVNKALSEGKPVPPEVLADYPDLHKPALSPTAKDQYALTKESTRESPAEVKPGDWSKGESRPFAFDPNSTENEGRFRLYPPEDIKPNTYISQKAVRSRGIEPTEGVRFLLADAKAGGRVIQAIRFDKSIMPEEKAKDWWEENKGKFEFGGIKKEQEVKQPSFLSIKKEEITGKEAKDVTTSNSKEWSDLFLRKLSTGRSEVQGILKDRLGKGFNPEDVRVPTELTGQQRETIDKGERFGYNVVFFDGINTASKYHGIFNPDRLGRIYINTNAPNADVAFRHEVIHSQSLLYPDEYADLRAKLKNEFKNFDQFRKSLNDLYRESGLSLPNQIEIENELISHLAMGENYEYVKDAEKIKTIIDEFLNKTNISRAILDSEKGAIDLSELRQAIDKAITFKKNIHEAMPHIEELGRHIYNSGMTKFEPWQIAMKQKLGDLWDSIKGYAKDIWENIASPIKDERGSFSFKKLKPEEEVAEGKKTGNELEKAYEKYKDVWIGNKDVRILKARVESSNLQKDIMEVLGKKKYDREAQDIDKAIQIHIDTKRNPEDVKKYWDKLTPEQKRIITLSQNLPKEVMPIVEAIEGDYKKIGLEALEEEVIRNVLDNYAARTWDFGEGKKGAENLRKFGTRTSHALQRKFATIIEGWGEGFNLKYEGATTNLRILKEEVGKTIVDKNFLDASSKIKDADGRPLLSTIHFDGYDRVEHPNFKKWKWAGNIEEETTERTTESRKILRETIKEVTKKEGEPTTAISKVEEKAREALRARGWSEGEAEQILNRIKQAPPGDVKEKIIEREIEKTIQKEILSELKIRQQGKNFFIDKNGNIFERREIYAPHEQAKNLNNILGVSKLYGIPGLATITKYNAIFKSWILLSSFFHNLAFSRNYFLGTPGTWKHPNIRNAYQDGNKAIQALDPDIVRGVKNGLTLGIKQDWEEDLVRQRTFIDNVLDKTKPTATVRNFIKDLRERQTDFLFEVMGAGLKTKSYLDSYRNILRRNPNMDPNEAAKIAAKLQNDNYGGLHLQRKGRNPTLQHLFRLFALAPDWTESNIDLVAGAFKKGGEGTQGRKAYQRLVGGWYLKALGVTALANYLLAGGDIDEMMKNYKIAWYQNNLRWLNIDVTPIYKALGGKGEQHKYFPLIGHMLDPIRLLAHPVKFAQNKGSVIYRIAHEALTGTDWTHREFTNYEELLTTGKTVKFGKGHPIEWNQFPSFVLSQTIGTEPVQVQEFIRWMNGEIEAFDAIGQSVGAGIISTYRIPQSRFERYAADIPHFGKEPTERTELKRKLGEQLRLEEPEAKERIKEAYREEKISERDKEDMERHAKMSSTARAAEHMTVDELAKGISKGLTEEEKRILKPVFKKRIDNAKNLDKETKRRYRAMQKEM